MNRITAMRDVDASLIASPPQTEWGFAWLTRKIPYNFIYMGTVLLIVHLGKAIVRLCPKHTGAKSLLLGADVNGQTLPNAK